MKTLDKNQMKLLSFPDADVNKMIIDLEDKKLRVEVSAAYSNESQGQLLGPGVLFFSGWKELVIKKFDYSSSSWHLLDSESIETLLDLSEVNFLDNTVLLSGFGVLSGSWIEWKIIEPKKMWAVFD